MGTPGVDALLRKINILQRNAILLETVKSDVLEDETENEDLIVYPATIGCMSAS